MLEFHCNLCCQIWELPNIFLYVSLGRFVRIQKMKNGFTGVTSHLTNQKESQRMMGKKFKGTCFFPKCLTGLESGNICQAGTTPTPPFLRASDS